MIKEKNREKRLNILSIMVVILLVIAAIVFLVRDGGLRGNRIKLDEEYYSEFIDYDNISAEEYEELVNDKKSFVVLVDQDGCDAADRLREFTERWSKEKKIKVQRIMFSKMRETSMHELVKYYPSVVVIEKGTVRDYLRADSDEDAEEYNDYEAFKKWMSEKIE